jgi:7-keto-8-aminopelargonate synthetase-like enzyme
MIEKVWVNSLIDFRLFSLSIQSKSAIKEEQKLHVREMTFPAVPTEEHPLRHVINIGALTPEDINLLAQTLDTVRTDRG